MSVRRALRPISVPLDRIEAARNVVLNSGRMSLLAPDDRAAIMDLAWATLREDRLRRCGPPPKARATGAEVVPMIAKRSAQRSDLRATPIPRRPRIIVRPVDPSTPGGAA